MEGWGFTGDNAHVSTPWVSVLTVVRDDPAGFARTVASVAAQSFDGVEFVVVDSSADRQAVPALLGDAGLAESSVYEWVEPAGIYPAMNAALGLASGDFAYFANAGDVLADSVLARARVLLADRVWGFGPVEIVELDGRRVVTPDWDYARERAAYFSRGHFPAHQGTFARRDALLSLGCFDTSYAIAADYAMALRLSLVSDPVVLPFVIATFREGGASTQRWQDSFREFHRARVEILEPSGLLGVQERWNTARHFGAVWVNRNLVARVRRGAA